MEQYNIHAAKTHLSALVDGVANGKSFVIAKAGRPLARVIPLALKLALPPPPPPPPTAGAGLMTVI